MELIQLKIVKEIFAARSLSKASMRLGKAPSIVSRHLTAFEKECGGRVFHRTGRGVQLTELGEQILPQIDRIIQALERMVDSGKTALQRDRRQRPGQCFPVICESLVPALYAQYQAGLSAHPAAVLRGLQQPDRRCAWRRERPTSPCSCATACPSAPIMRPSASTTLTSSACRARACRGQMWWEDRRFCSPTSRVCRCCCPPSRVSRAMRSTPWRRAEACRCPSQPRSTRWPAWRRCSIPMPDTSSPLSDAGLAAESGHIGREIRQGRLKAARIRDPDVKRTLVVGTAPSVSSRVEVVRRLLWGY